MSAQHVGETLRELLEERDEEQVLWARRIGISTKHMSQIVTGKVGLSADIAVRMEAHLGLDALTLMRLQVAYDVDQARHTYAEANPIEGLVPSWAFVVPAETPAERVLDGDERGGH